MFEDFSSTPIPTVDITEPKVEAVSPDDLKTTYDDGYKNGWEDAVAASKNDTEKAQADIAAALQELGFTYFEARHHVLNSLKPLIEALTSLVVPNVAKALLAPRILEEITALSDRIDPPFDLLCAAENETILREAMEAANSVPIKLKIEPTLTVSQVLLKYDGGQSTVDIEPTLAVINESIAEFYQLANEKEKTHG